MNTNKYPKLYPLIAAVLVFGTLLSGCNGQHPQAMTSENNPVISTAPTHTEATLSTQDTIPFDGPDYGSTDSEKPTESAVMQSPAPIIETAPYVESPSTEECAPTEDTAPTEECAPTEDAKPAEAYAPIEEYIPTKEYIPTEEYIPAEESTATENIDWSEIPPLLHPNILNPDFVFNVPLRELTVEQGKTQLLPYAYPGHPSELTFCIEDTAIAVVDEWGQITGIERGQTIIAVTDGNSMFTSRITVIPAVPEAPVLTEEEKSAAALAVAQEIAYIIMNDPTLTTDLARIAMAARFINAYVDMGHSTSLHPDYNKPYGTLVAGFSSCAGSTRAMGLVLECMGYTWAHVNENQWSHQWCIVYGMDGQTGFADGSAYGIAGYGSREDQSNWRYMTNTGELVVFNDYFNQ